MLVLGSEPVLAELKLGIVDELLGWAPEFLIVGGISAFFLRYLPRSRDAEVAEGRIMEGCSTLFSKKTIETHEQDN